uniref:Uncharacterized protein n=1 Tax=Branchiostoma floridae TaxID=7739 RepID=C3YG67_BRAFL|eukprot:XP_002604577.1 hypothetical protein BRAFLDRAFT_92799 [Branchiostoma floridae]
MHILAVVMAVLNVLVATRRGRASDDVTDESSGQATGAWTYWGEANGNRLYSSESEHSCGYMVVVPREEAQTCPSVAPEWHDVWSRDEPDSRKSLVENKGRQQREVQMFVADDEALEHEVTEHKRRHSGRHGRHDDYNDRTREQPNIDGDYSDVDDSDDDEDSEADQFNFSSDEYTENKHVFSGSGESERVHSRRNVDTIDSLREQRQLRVNQTLRLLILENELLKERIHAKALEMQLLDGRLQAEFHRADEEIPADGQGDGSRAGRWLLANKIWLLVGRLPAGWRSTHFLLSWWCWNIPVSSHRTSLHNTGRKLTIASVVTDCRTRRLGDVTVSPAPSPSPSLPYPQDLDARGCCAACGRPQAPASPPHRSSPHSHNQGVKCVQTTGKRRLPGRAGRNNPSQCGVHLRTSVTFTPGRPLLLRAVITARSPCHISVYRSFQSSRKKGPIKELQGVYTVFVAGRTRRGPGCPRDNPGPDQAGGPPLTVTGRAVVARLCHLPDWDISAVPQVCVRLVGKGVVLVTLIRHSSTLKSFSCCLPANLRCLLWLPDSRCLPAYEATRFQVTACACEATRFPVPACMRGYQIPCTCLHARLPDSRCLPACEATRFPVPACVRGYQIPGACMRGYQIPGACLHARLPDSRCLHCRLDKP